MTFWTNVLPNILLQGQNAQLVVRKAPQNFYQCVYLVPKQNSSWIIVHNAWLSYSVLDTSKTTFSLPLRRVYLDLRYISLNKQKRVLVSSNQ